MNDSQTSLPEVFQSPVPGNSRVMYCGDTVRFTLALASPSPGKAWVRTNLGAADITRRETINRVEKNEIKLDSAWYDMEMEQVGKSLFQIELPLHEPGFFQVKCFFIPKGENVPVWPEGTNTLLNVEPAGTCCANIIYNAFVRQFGKSKYGPVMDGEAASMIEALDKKGFTVIPESGKFRDLKKEVGFIFSQLGCRALHLLPVHPTPTTYARMGRFGSPYAALNFTEVDPALAQFDHSATPLEQFMELVDTVHFYNGYLIMDIAINHTGWAAAIHESHPEWLVREEDGKITAPGAWGITWEDLTKLDYSHVELWQYMADIFLLWCHRGVDGFRCDAGYMIPVDAWEYMVAKVREKYPDTIFFLEGLGGLVSVTREILSRANFNWAYSELFQNYSREEISAYLPPAMEISDSCGHLIHFAETHDNNRLAAISPVYAKMRTSLCAMFSICGGFGFANGVEWFADQKINVHDSPGLNWGSSHNQVDHISLLNRVLKRHPAFFEGARLELIQHNKGQCLVLLRYQPKQDKQVLVLVNLDCEKEGTAEWSALASGITGGRMFDLLSGEEVWPDMDGGVCRLMLDPGEVKVLTPDQEDAALIHEDEGRSGMPERVLSQKLKAMVLRLHTAVKGYGPVGNMDLQKEADQLAADPVEFIRAMDGSTDESRTIIFDIEKDIRRRVMVPSGFFLLVRGAFGFRAELMDESGEDNVSLGYEEALPTADRRSYFAVLMPREIKKRHREYKLHLRVFKPDAIRAEKGSVLYLAPFETLVMRSAFTRKEIGANPYLKILGTTKQGGMMRAAASWGSLYSRYDALLGANLDPRLPENRQMLLSRCRIWSIFQGYSRELALDCLEALWFSYDHGGKWVFHVPTSEGKYYALELFLSINRDANHVGLLVRRLKSRMSPGRMLEDDWPVTVVIRPDIEDRSFHETTKAYLGPEHEWPARVDPFETGFHFGVSNGQHLYLNLPGSQFIQEPEWHYMVHRPVDEQRGMDHMSDLFSPGYFEFPMKGSESFCLDAAVIEENRKKSGTRFPRPRVSFKKTFPLSDAVYSSLDAFLVDRENDKSVVAGYPWFLDWGRDSLIFCRGLIELGRIEEAKAVMRLFGRFEKGGTLPNMICGSDARNIETSDAPLWFAACCRDLAEKEEDLGFLEEKLDGRTIEQVLLSIGRSLLAGTKTGVKVDPDTFLLYSPGHFTWMDTNYPAGTPRQGYPVEIQALWHSALSFLARIDSGGEWNEKAKVVKRAVEQYFWQPEIGFFSDCLHSEGPTGAAHAVPDDALRPNQLLLITLGVIDDKKMLRSCVETCQELLVPGAIRSLADRRVSHPVNIYHDGSLLKDPHLPYSGRYEGDEDTQRKPAYHNGTAWTWPFPIFCEAWAEVFGKPAYSTCLAWLGSVIDLMRSGAAGYLPEIVDGDCPHTPRGCDAQAWGCSEAARVIHKLTS